MSSPIFVHQQKNARALHFGALTRHAEIEHPASYENSVLHELLPSSASPTCRCRNRGPPWRVRHSPKTIQGDWAKTLITLFFSSFFFFGSGLLFFFLGLCFFFFFFTIVHVSDRMVPRKVALKDFILDAYTTVRSPR